MMSSKLWGLAAGLGLLGAAACSGTSVGTGSGAADQTSALSFHAEASPLKDFSYDTGLLPADSPAQVQLKLSAGGEIKVDASADRSSDGLVGKAGGGKLALDIHFKMTGRLKVDSTFKSYDGEIPGLSNIDIPIAGNSAFDGFLLGDGESASATADLPETTLPAIPLGSVPGKLVITVAKGSTLTTKIHGACLTVASGEATYKGESKTSGNLVLKAQIVLELPAPLAKTIDLPAITVAIPEVTTSADAAAIAVSGVADSTKGSCGAVAATTAPAPAKPAPSTSDAGVGDSGADAGPYDGHALTCGGVGSGTEKCDICLSAQCCTFSNNCIYDVDCTALLDCEGGCADQACTDKCIAEHPTGHQVLLPFVNCFNVTCKTACQ